MQAREDAAFGIGLALCLVLLLIPLFGALAWTLIGMRRGLVNSNNAIRQVEEGLILSRRSVEIGEESLKQQEEIIRLLRELCNRLDPGKYKPT
ncbi:MAG TPA: hypothetical protein VFE62_17895 [Gemmataceae bacterium]|nr:hypothetical protein [Gemmataceae bacterium]